MSDSTNTANAGEQNEGKQFEPISTQDELDRIVTARVARERAKFQDYDALKEKAEKYDSAVSELSALKADKQLREWKDAVAKEFGVPAAALRGGDLEELRAHGEVLKSLIAAQSKAPVVPNAGDQPETKSSPEAAFVRELFGGK